MSTILEYVWLDGYKPEPNLRSKIRVEDRVSSPPWWSFDGSSTKQAGGKNSDCILRALQQICIYLMWIHFPSI